MLQASSILRATTSNEQARAHTRRLLSLLVSQVDSISRHELYSRLASKRGARDYDAIFRRIIESDCRHIKWLRGQITHEILGSQPDRTEK